MSDPLNSRTEERIEHAAADWLIRRDRGLSAPEQDAFFQWLAADPRHGERFAQHQRTWKEFNLLAQWRPEHSAEPNPDLLAKPHRRVRWLAWTAPLALAASLALGFFLSSRTTPTTDIAAPTIARANQGTRVLEDGSTVELRNDSEIAVAFTEGERRVALVRGEAFFTVAKNASLPFIVHANGVDVRAVGTAFNVRLDVDRVEVLVTEGRVGVRGPGAQEGGQTVEDASFFRESHDFRSPLSEILVSGGERAVVSLAPAVAPSLSVVDDAEIARLLAWQPRLLDFESTPLAEIVAEFNRRNSTQLVLADATLETMPIVASVRSDNVEGFVRLLEAGGSVRVERRRDRIVLRAAW
jgi:transmembrane sensor